MDARPLIDAAVRAWRAVGRPRASRCPRCGGVSFALVRRGGSVRYRCLACGSRFGRFSRFWVALLPRPRRVPWWRRAAMRTLRPP